MTFFYACGAIKNELRTPIYDRPMFSSGDVFVTYMHKHNVLGMTIRNVAGATSDVILPFTHVPNRKRTIMWPIVHNRRLYYVVYRRHSLHILQHDDNDSYCRLLSHKFNDKRDHKIPVDIYGRLCITNSGRVLETDQRGMIGFRYARSRPYSHVFDIVWINMQTYKLSYEYISPDTYGIYHEYRGIERLEPLHYDRVRDTHYLITHNDSNDQPGCTITKQAIRSHFIAIRLIISNISAKLANPDHRVPDDMQNGSSFIVWGSQLWFYYRPTSLSCLLNIDDASRSYKITKLSLSAEHFAPITDTVRVRGGYEYYADTGHPREYSLVYMNMIDISVYFVDAALPADAIEQRSVLAIGSIP